MIACATMQDSSVADLAISLFGRFEAGSSLRFASARCRELLALLLVERSREVGHETLIECLWPNERQPDNPRRALNTELWRLRRAIATSDFAGHVKLERSSVGIRLTVGPEVAVDLHRFGDLVAQLRSPVPSRLAYDAARSIDQLYAGDLLPEFYADWALLAREAVRNDYVFAMEHRLGEAMRVNDWADAIHFARRVLRVEPLLEHVHRQLMTCQLRMGDRAAAIMQYRELERRLARELDCSPMPETSHLFQSLNDRGEVAIPDVSAGNRRRFTPIALRLEQAIVALSAAADALKRLDDP